MRIAFDVAVGDAEVADDGRRDRLALRIEVDLRMRGARRRNRCTGCAVENARATAARPPASSRAAAGGTGGAPGAATSVGPAGSTSHASCSSIPYAFAADTTRQLSIAPVGHGAMHARQLPHTSARTT